MTNRILYILLVLTLISTGCKKGRKDDKDGAKKVNVDPKPVYHDSADIIQYLTRWSDRIAYGDVLHDLYKERDYAVTWFHNEKPRPQIPAFLERLKNVHLDGLRASDYDIAEAEKLYNQVINEKDPDESDILRLDLMLSTFFTKYIIQLNTGLSNDRRQDFDWYIDAKDQRLPVDSILTVALNTPDDQDPFRIAQPQHPQYGTLKKVL
ncbi:MAG: hypothetical protein M3Q97_11480, partial [Bacteroidota bacterium]|nr:hypothetical protein [Bacteroidota bacterium]